MSVYKCGNRYRIGYKRWFGIMIWAGARGTEDLVWECDNESEANTECDRRNQTRLTEKDGWELL